MSVGFGVGDVVLVSGLAWKLYKACRDSGGEFQQLSAELTSLHVVMCEIKDYLAENSDLEASRRNRLEILCENSKGTLLELEGLLQRYESLGTQAQRTWDRVRFGTHNVTDLRARLTSHATLLSAFNTAMANSSAARLEKRLNKFMAEVQAGLREGSVVTTPDAAETIESPDVWDELRRELEDIGISGTVIEEKRDFILDWMKTALAEGNLDELPSIDTASLQLSDTAHDSAYGGSQHRSRAGTRSLIAANEEFAADIERQRRENLIPDLTENMMLGNMRARSPPRVVRRRTDPVALVRKMFEKETAIVQAASDGDIKRVAKLISVGMDVNATDRWGWSALSMCAYGGHEEIARLLLDHGADLDNIDVDGDTPTSLAAQRRHTKLVILFDEVREARDRELREMDGKVPGK